MVSLLSEYPSTDWLNNNAEIHRLEFDGTVEEANLYFYSLRAIFGWACELILHMTDQQKKSMLLNTNSM